MMSDKRLASACPKCEALVLTFAESQRVEAGSARAQLLNPRVKLSTRTDKTLLQDENFLKNFNLVVLTDVDASTAVSSE